MFNILIIKFWIPLISRGDCIEYSIFFNFFKKTHIFIEEINKNMKITNIVLKHYYFIDNL